MTITLKTTDIDEATKIAIEHLKTLKTRSHGDHGCTYLGNRCAVGALLEFDDDGEARLQWYDQDGTIGVDELRAAINNWPTDIGESEDLLNRLESLQDLHDRPDNWGQHGIDPDIVEAWLEEHPPQQ